jgi:hypothetical protein
MQILEQLCTHNTVLVQQLGEASGSFSFWCDFVWTSGAYMYCTSICKTGDPSPSPPPLSPHLGVGRNPVVHEGGKWRK